MFGHFFIATLGVCAAILVVCLALTVLSLFITAICCLIKDYNHKWTIH